MNQLPIQSSYERTFLNTTQIYFNKYPRNWQLPVGCRIISDICENSETLKLCMQPTGNVQQEPVYIYPEMHNINTLPFFLGNSARIK